MVILDLDPVTGAPVRVNVRLQFNVFIEKTSEFFMMENFPNALLPILWFDDAIELPKFLVDEINFGHNLLVFLK